MEVPQYVISPSNSLLSSSPHGCGLIMLNDSKDKPVFGIILLSFTELVLSVAWHPYLFIYMVPLSSRVKRVLYSAVSKAISASGLLTMCSWPSKSKNWIFNKLGKK